MLDKRLCGRARNARSKLLGAGQRFNHILDIVNEDHAINWNDKDVYCFGTVGEDGRVLTILHRFTGKEVNDF